MNRLPKKVVGVLKASQKLPETFAAMLDAFGPLPEDGQYDLANRMVAAAEVYTRMRRARSSPRPFEERERLVRIGAATKQLLVLLGIDDPQSIAVNPLARGMGILHPVVSKHLLIELFRVAAERRPATATLSADERVVTLLLLLSDLAEAAERSAHEVTRLSKPKAKTASPPDLPKQGGREPQTAGRGGDRREGRTAEGELIHSIIEVYAVLCEHFPENERQPAFDDRLVQFVRAGLRFVVASAPIFGADGVQYESGEMAWVDRNLPTRITNAAIRSAFNRWCAQTKSETPNDLSIS
jgi:hypothetical protein